MRRALLLACTLCLLLITPVYATEESEEMPDVLIPETPAAVSAPDAVPDPAKAVSPVLSLDTAYRTFSVSSLDDVASVPPDGDSSTMAQVVTKVLGVYERKTMTVQEMDTDGNVLATSTQYVPGLAGMDWEWIAGAALFGLFLFCVMRLIGGLLKQ